MEKIVWKHNENGSKSYTFEIVSGLLSLSFILFWDLKENKWYLSGDGIADYYDPIKCNSKEEANNLVREQLDKLRHKVKSMLDEIDEYTGSTKDGYM